MANLTKLKYRLLMALRSEDLPSDPAGLIEMVLSLDAENDRLRAVIGTFKNMVFGSRSEELAVVVADQLALDLADLVTDVTLPSAAHVRSKPAGATGKHRKKAQRNIGALPKHLPRCEQVIEPETTACPCCQSRLHKIGQDVSEVLDVIPAILRVVCTPSASSLALQGERRGTTPGMGL
jgi:transposase